MSIKDILASIQALNYLLNSTKLGLSISLNRSITLVTKIKGAISMNPLKFGWIDYSNEHREKVLAVLHALSTEGAVDELGIGQIRDGFSNILFPGTSTIQTRAKYFFIIPYILMELEKEKFTSPNELVRKLYDIELGLINKLNIDNPEGVIGARSGKTLKRKPSTIYWNGLRTFGIFKKYFSLQTYAKAAYRIKNNENIENRFGSDIESNTSDIADEYSNDFWRCLLPAENWQEDLTINLSYNEAVFLKERIIKAEGSKDSLLSYFLFNNKSDDLENANDFDSIGELFDIPDEIRTNYIKAKGFNRFISGANIRYNIILSQGENPEAIEYWNDWKDSSFVQNDFQHFNFMEIIKLLNIKNSRLISFLRKWQQVALSSDEEAINDLIIKREIELKGTERAKLNNTKTFNYEEGDWVGLLNLQYRFSDAKIILNDIFTGLET